MMYNRIAKIRIRWRTFEFGVERELRYDEQIVAAIDNAARPLASVGGVAKELHREETLSEPAQVLLAVVSMNADENAEARSDFAHQTLVVGGVAVVNGGAEDALDDGSHDCESAELSREVKKTFSEEKKNRKTHATCMIQESFAARAWRRRRRPRGNAAVDRGHRARRGLIDVDQNLARSCWITG